MKILDRIGFVILSLAAVILLTVTVFAGTDSGADFLKIPIGARGQGLGQAYSALADGVDSMNWNTAGIIPSSSRAPIGMTDLSLSHQVLFFGNSLDYVAFSMPREHMSLGMSITRLSYPTQDGRDEQRNETGSFGASDTSVGMALATRVQGMRIGTNLKLIHQELANESANGFAMDMGLLSRTPISRLNLGASVKNLGPSMHFLNDDYQLPLTLSIGAAYQVMGPLVLALDLKSLPRQKQTAFSIGSEFAASNTVSLRAGYLANVATRITNSQKDETNRGSFGSISGLNAGLGISLASMRLDYAISPFGELGNIHTFTLSTSFGGAKPQDEIKTTPAEEDRTIIIFDKSSTESPLDQPSK